MNKAHKNQKQEKPSRIKVVGKFPDAETTRIANEDLKIKLAHHPTIIIWPIEDEVYLPILCAKEDESEVRQALLERDASKALTDPGTW